MLAKLELKLKCEKELTYQMSSLFHGALMELLPEKYADYLHISSLHPYAQHLECREGNWYWVITGLNKEAVKVLRLLGNTEVKHINTTVGPEQEYFLVDKKQ